MTIDWLHCCIYIYWYNYWYWFSVMLTFTVHIVMIFVIDDGRFDVYYWRWWYFNLGHIDVDCYYTGDGDDWLTYWWRATFRICCVCGLLISYTRCIVVGYCCWLIVLVLMMVVLLLLVMLNYTDFCYSDCWGVCYIIYIVTFTFIPLLLVIAPSNYPPRFMVTGYCWPHDYLLLTIGYTFAVCHFVAHITLVLLRCWL